MREDANRIALLAARRLIEAACDLELEVDGVTVDVAPSIGPAAAWPQEIEGVDPETDGPWPPSVHLACSWSGGSTELVLRPDVWFKDQGVQNIAVRLDLVSPAQQLVWIDVAQQTRKAEDGQTARLTAAVSFMARKGESTGLWFQDLAKRLASLVGASGLPMATAKWVDIARVRVPEGSIEPSAEEAYRRLVHVALLKLPFMARGQTQAYEGTPLIDIAVPTPEEAIDEETGPEVEGARYVGLSPLPGGVRRYKKTLDELLGWIQEDQRTSSDLRDHLAARYDTTGDRAMAFYARLLSTLGFAEETDDLLALTTNGEQYLANPTSELLFETMHERWQGLLETLVIAEETKGARTARTHELLTALLGTDWKSQNQSAFRRNWLLSMGLVERTSDGDVVTDAGRSVLEKHASEAEKIRAQLAEILEATGTDDGGDDPSELPPAWHADRLDMLGEQVESQAEPLVLAPELLMRIAAALSAGRHLLLVGPPGTGKTRLAHAIASAARQEGYCHGLLPATASADWSSFEVIGGYSLQKDGSLAFRSGVFLRAIEEHRWLLIDELNRADADRAFGELMTVLSGSSARTPYEDAAGRFISMGESSQHTHRVPKTFRVLATMNTWDKTSLFRLSYALQRRFAILPVEPPPPAAYSGLLEREAIGPGLDTPLEAKAAQRVVQLFEPARLLGIRAVGPAVPMEMIRYMRRRQAAGNGLAEAMMLYLLPQLEGLAQDDATRAREHLLSALDGWTSESATAEVDAALGEMFPHLAEEG